MIDLTAYLIYFFRYMKFGERDQNCSVPPPLADGFR